MSSIVTDKDCNLSSTYCKTLAEIAAETLATSAAEEIAKGESKEIRDAIKYTEETITQSKDVLAISIVVDNTSSQSSSWSLIQKTLYDLIPFLDSRHGDESNFNITYEIRIIYANDYDYTHCSEAAKAKRNQKEYIATPRVGRDSDNPVVGEVCRITSEASCKEKEDFLNTINSMACYGGGDLAEAYAPALELALEHVNEFYETYGSNAVIATIFCGDDIPHGCSSQEYTRRDNWPEGDPSGVDWFEVISRFPCPIHCLSPPHADSDSKCALGYAVSKTGGFHLNVDEKSSVVLLRLLMAEMKLSWLVERNIKDMKDATPEDISESIARIINKESFVKPNNTVEADPRIDLIDKEIKNNGHRPNLMRSVSHAHKPRPNVRPRNAVSTLEKGVTEDGIMRALRSATGGTMMPKLMRQVSDSVVRSTRVCNE